MAILIIVGPTGVGKTDYALKLATQLEGEIINADSGQMYTPLTIGTAKPVYQTSVVPHHCFDLIDTPKQYSVVQYRQILLDTIQGIKKRAAVPILVGGSGFYIKSLFFPPYECQMPVQETEIRYHDNVWEQLNAIDPERAAQLHPNDTYRIKRALTIWYQYQKKPSACKPEFSPIDDAIILFLTRERDDLYQRINQRVISTLNGGWIEEVASLQGTEWETFIMDKKIIGYDLIMSYLKNTEKENNAALLCEKIQKKTRNYAKQQLIFWKSFKKQLLNAPHTKTNHVVLVNELNLTLAPHDLYINQLRDQLRILNTRYTC